MPKAAIRAVFRELVSGCRALVRPLRIAIWGRFIAIAIWPPCIASAGRSSSYRWEPLRPSSKKSTSDIRTSAWCRWKTRPMGGSPIRWTCSPGLPVRICGQVEMHIHHTLLAKCARNEIREVYSKPQAISQCRNWLAKHLPLARMIEVTSTTMAAQLAAEKLGAAAIASQQAGVEYDLEILAENIEDNPHNATRFAVIGGQIPERTGNDRTAILFQMDHRPGTLADAMNVFKRNKLNLTWIESFPVPGSDRAYMFFAEVETHPTELRFRRAMAALQRKALRLEVLGAFPVTEAVG